jgi:hypothetical protein
MPDQCFRFHGVGSIQHVPRSNKIVGGPWPQNPGKPLFQSGDQRKKAGTPHVWLLIRHLGTLVVRVARRRPCQPFRNIFHDQKTVIGDGRHVPNSVKHPSQRLLMVSNALPCGNTFLASNASSPTTSALSAMISRLGVSFAVSCFRRHGTNPSTKWESLTSESADPR